LSTPQIYYLAKWSKLCYSNFLLLRKNTLVYKQLYNKIYKALSFISGILLVFYSLAPSMLYAQEATPTPSPSEEPAVSSSGELQESPTPTPESTNAPEPSSSVLPEASPTPTPSPVPSSEPSPTDQVEGINTPDETVGQPNAPPEISPSPSLTPQPSPDVEVEQTAQGHLSATILENTDAQSLELDLTTQDVSSSSLITDKADYAPTDTAVITGSDFPKQTELKLVITADNYRFETNVTTDENGSFIYSYQLDGTYRPLYKVEAYDISGTLLATVTFTDSGPKITAKTHQGQKSDNSWTSGNVTTYQEGDTINFRFNAKVENAPASGQLEVRFSENDGTCLFFDNYFVLGATENVSGTTPSVSVVSGPTVSSGEWIVILNISGSTNGEGRINYQLRLSNQAGQCSGSSQHSRLNPAGGDVEQSGQQNVPVPAQQVIELPDITVTKNIDRDGNGSFESTAIAEEYSFTLDGTTTLSTNASGQVIFTNITPNGAHSITETQLDFSQGTYQFISGSGVNCTFVGSTATATVSSGTTATNASCNFNNAQQNGTVIVHKDVQGPNGEVIDDISQNFTVRLDSANPQSLTDNDSYTYNNVAAGLHTITENTPPSGYTLYGISTTPGGSGNTGGLSVSVTAGQTTDVYVTNRQQQTKLTLTKTVINNNGGTKVVSDFVLKIDGNQVTSGVANNVASGSHTASEVNRAGYSASSWGGDCNTDGTITLALGDNKTCTITNDDIQPKLTVTKVVVNDNGGIKVVSDFPLFVDATSVTSGVQNGFNAGTYNISETSQNGYTAAIFGDCAENGSITLSVGDVKSCTINNNDQPAHVIVIKNVTNNDNGTKTPSDFTMHIDGTAVGTGVSFAGASGLGTSTTVNAGSFTVTEDPVAGYSGSLSGDCSGTIANGETKTCTVTNDDQPANLIVIKHVVNDNGGTAAATDFTMYINGTSVGTGVSFPGAESPGINTTVKAGSFTVAEDSVPGYSASTSGDCSGTLANGETKTCTITNNDQAANIIVIKNVTNDNGGSKNPGDFMMHINGTSVGVGVSFAGVTGAGVNTQVNAGSFTVTEDSVPGYSGSSSGDCSGSIANGETKTCTFTNNDQAGHLIVHKVTDPSDTTTQFSITASGTASVTTPTRDISGGSSVDYTVDAGTYSVSEADLAGWDETGNTCSNIVVVNNATEECTITNTKRGHVVIVKDSINNSTQDFTFRNDFGNENPATFVLDDDGPSGSVTPKERDFEVLPGTTYAVSEDEVLGWQQESQTCNQGETVDSIDVAPGETVTCTFVNEEFAKIILVKNTIGGNGTFDFLMSGDGLPAGAQLTTSSNTASQTFSDLDQDNTYSIAEITPDPDEWELTSASCTGTNTPASITPSPGETVTCTFTNTKEPKLTVTKIVVNDNGGIKEISSFPLFVDGDSVISGVQNTSTIGVHVVSETGDPDYTATIGGDCDAQGNITLAAGDVKECTVTNNDKVPSLTLNKVVVNDNGGTKEASDWSLYASAGNVGIGGTGPTVSSDPTFSAGIYTLSEVGPSGYSPSGWVCEGGSQEGDTITLSLGQSATCTITNDDIAPTLTLIKTVVINDGGTATEADFQAYINDNPTSWNQPQTLSVGDYTASELANVSGYTPSEWTGDCDADGNVSLAEGENKTCYITNDDQSAHLILVKNLPNDNGGIATQDDFGVFIDEQEAFWGDNEVDAGSHTVNESTLAGYTPSGWGQDCNENGNVTLLPGETKTCTITNDDQPGSITGTKWNDLDSDGQRGEEPGLDGWHIQLFENNDGDKGVQIGADEVTNVDGDYSFSQVNAGDYFICEVPQTGWVQTYPVETCHAVTVELEQQLTDYNFGNQMRGTITLVKDAVPNNSQDFTFTSSQLGTFKLDDNGNATLSNTKVFSNLGSNTYTITESAVSGWKLTNLVCTGDDNAIIDLNGRSVTLNLDRPGEDISCKFTNTKYGSIQGRKYNDLNGSGTYQESTEPSLDDWTIHLFNNLWGEVASMETGDDTTPAGNVSTGQYKFVNLLPGVYYVCEDLQIGWTQTDPSSGQIRNNTYCRQRTVNAGQNITGVLFGNQGRGTITVHKNVDVNGDGDLEDEGIDIINSTDWTWDINNEGDFATGDNSQAVAAGDYIVSEDPKDGYHITSVECNEAEFETSESIEINVEAGDNLVCTFTNTRDSGDLRVNKVTDSDGDGQYDTTNPENFLWGTEAEATSYNMGSTQTLISGDYSVYENSVPGYIFTGWFPGDPVDSQYSCTNLPEGDIYTQLPVALTVVRDEPMEITLCNQLLNPILTISKSNDKSGIDVSAGASVVYTLTVTLTGSSLNDVSVVDLPPAGFIYRSGSWTANSSVRGDLKPGTTGEPTYASPGVWNLGDMQSGEVVTLTYIVDIDGSTDPGLYKDLAWASGTNLASTKVLANETSGLFVGTEVNVVKDQGSSTGVEVERIEEGKVLGISTALPATGANTVWLILAALMLSSGAGLIFAGITIRKKYD